LHVSPVAFNAIEDRVFAANFAGNQRNMCHLAIPAHLAIPVHPSRLEVPAHSLHEVISGTSRRATGHQPASSGMCVRFRFLAFGISGSHNRNLIRCKSWRASLGRQRVSPRNFVAFRVPAHNADKIPPVPLRAFDALTSWGAPSVLQRLRSSSPSTTKGNIMSDNTKKPVERLNVFPVSAAIWRNQTAKGAFYSVTFERSYRDEAGKWQTSQSFNASDLLALSKLADLVDTKVRELRAADRQPEEEAA
jgi:hypothetical protein